MKIVKCRKTTLKTPLTSTATSVKLDALVDSKDVAVVLASFGSWFVLVIKQGDLTEMIKCDALTQNADGSATAGVATSGRGLNPTSPYAGSATGFDFSTGAEVIVTNDPLTMAEFAHLNDANTWTGINTFTETAMPRVSASHTYIAGQEEYLATKRYVDSVAVAGAPDASTTAKGIVEVQTQAEFEAGTSTGGTSAPLVHPANIGARFFSGYAVDAGGTDAYAITLSPVPSAFFTGMMISFKANTINTGACTLNPNALGAKSLKYNGADPVDGFIGAGATVLCVYDGTNFNILSVTAGSTLAGLPTGIISPYAGRTAPFGYLLCDGTTVSRATYAGLFTVLNPTLGTVTMTIATPAVLTLASHGLATGDGIYFTTTGALPTGLAINTKYWVVKIDANTFNVSTTLANALAGTKIATSGSQSGTHTMFLTPYGVGDGTTTFTLPSMKGIVPIGYDQTQSDFAGLGQTGGEKTHVLTLAESPSHTHGLPMVVVGGGSVVGVASQSSGASAISYTTQYTDSRGGDGAHNNIQPYVTTSYIIKY
jgi:microcystin-dependent protein